MTMRHNPPECHVAIWKSRPDLDVLLNPRGACRANTMQCYTRLWPECYCYCYCYYYYTILYSIILYYAMLCYAILYYTRLD